MIGTGPGLIRAALPDMQWLKLLHQIRSEHRRKPIARAGGIYQLVAVIVAEHQRIESRPAQRNNHL
jgi:hypothetical protein